MAEVKAAKGTSEAALARKKKADRVRSWLDNDKVHDFIIHVEVYKGLTIVVINQENKMLRVRIYTDTDLARWWDAACMRLKGDAESIDEALNEEWPAGNKDETPELANGEV